MQTIWGFDLGVTSVGFAVVKWDGWATPDGCGEILRLGVRVFPETREMDTQGPGDPLNASRRQKRLMRRQTRRRRWRRVHLRALLSEAGLLPDANGAPPGRQDPYALRARGLVSRLSPEETGWAIFHLLKRRGFQESRKIDPAEAPLETDQRGAQHRPGRLPKSDTGIVNPKSTKTKEEEEERKRGEALAARLKGRRLSTFLQSDDHLKPVGTSPLPWEIPRRRAVGQTRRMVREEFEDLWAEQARHHPSLLTPELKSRIEAVALAQRPTFFRARTVGMDDLEPSEPRALKAEWITQRFEMLQLVNALRLERGNQRQLAPDERVKAIEYLESERRPTWAGLRAAIGIGQADRFTHERGEKSTVRGNATEAALRAALGDVWLTLPEPTREAIRERIGAAWHRIAYRPTKGGAILEIRDHAGIARERAALADHARETWGLPPEAADALARIDLPDGAARHSLKAMRRLLPHLEAGVPYMTAVEREYGARRQAGTPIDRLPAPNHSELSKIEDPWVREQMAALLASIRNPTVLRTLGELRKVVNTLLRAHGRPDVIRLEFARDLKQSAEERRRTDERQRDREKARKAARQEVANLGKPAEGSLGEENILRWLLWKEQGERSPYSGNMIGCSDALDPTVTQIDHIFPVSRSFDDSQANKVLCFTRENTEKGRRTPFEWLSADADRWAELTMVWQQMKDAGWPDTKRRRCLKARLEDPEADEASFTNRQLVDTAFVARAARPYLGLLFGGGQDGLNRVQPVSARATALLRRGWGIGLGRLLDGPDDGPKVRDDLRHHAVDALAVALTTPRTVAELSRWWQDRETGRRPPAFRSPWPGFREHAKAAVETILVSHRVQAKLSGALHEETRLGATMLHETDGSRIFVKRKAIQDLSASEIRGTKDTRIADEGVRRAILDHLEANGLKLEQTQRDAARDTETERRLKALLAQEIRLKLTDATRKRWASQGMEAKQGPVIRRVRLHIRRKEGVMPVHAEKNIHAELGPGTNDHIAIYRDGETVRFLVATKREALVRVQNGQPAVLPEHPKGGRLVMALRRGDVLRRQTANGEEFVLIRFAYGNGQIFFKPLTMAGQPRPQVSKKPAVWLREGWHKIVVDPIGRWRPAR
ncbi:MAG: type II CRISPR RNA-guided endonuclease Cas9 [Burkholderiaceae bacterium]|nr:type II CRISPR RNA-guided endonuclease Cas9 [Burkholderiaceae bacterium]